jgi:hypothetical protein
MKVVDLNEIYNYDPTNLLRSEPCVRNQISIWEWAKMGVVLDK